MNKLMISLLSCFVLTILALPGLSQNKKNSAWDKEVDLLYKWNYGQIKIDQAPIFEKPNKNAKIIKNRVLGDKIQLEYWRPDHVPEGWIPLNNRLEANGEEYPILWIERKNVAIPGDHRKVIGCWPVKGLAAGYGHCDVDYHFKTNGSAVLDFQCDGMYKPIKTTAQVYMAGNAVWIDIKRKDLTSFYHYRYLPESKSIELDGINDEQELFSPKEMKGCKSGPKLDTKPAFFKLE